MARKFEELRAKMSPESRTRAKALARQDMDEMALDELREARRMTQEHLAELLNVQQSAISKIERRTDMYVSTLQAIIKAMGGRLRIQAEFPEGTVEIKRFGKLKRHTAA